jgi:L-seryl-tRNA(Ser) seleniumtransferase
LIVNNCAAAALLVLSAVAKGGEVIVSRGELVEIGGDFRIPDVLEQSGCKLREVGTTNRTKLFDYERAITEQTKVILHVHPSNFRITGFTETPDLDELADLAHRNKLILLEDAGSGALIDLSELGLGEEPVISRCVTSGADVVVFSGDKLVGGIQAGLIVGKREAIAKISRHPLYRAVRADKIVYAAIEATLNSFARGTAFVEIPILRMLLQTLDEISERATRLLENLHGANLVDFTAEMIQGFSAIGGGAGADVKLPTALIALSLNSGSADDLAVALRSRQTPVLTRINEGRVLIDLRTVNESDDEIILSALKEIRVD